MVELANTEIHMWDNNNCTLGCNLMVKDPGSFLEEIVLVVQGCHKSIKVWRPDVCHLYNNNDGGLDRAKRMQSKALLCLPPEAMIMMETLPRRMQFEAGRPWVPS